MNEEKFKSLLLNKGTYEIIKILRDGPLKVDTIADYLEKTSNLKQKGIIKKIKVLEENEVLYSFSINHDIKYYILLKDFYIIRVPPKELLDGINRLSKVPKRLKERYLIDIKNYFSQYVSSTSKLKNDLETNLIEFVLNPLINETINHLKKKPIKLKSIAKKIPVFDKISDMLLNNQIIEILSEAGNNWVFLKTQFKFEIFFPEYLIKTVTQNLKEKKLDKSIALKSLYALKQAYLKVEKPEEYEDLIQRIKNKEELINLSEKRGELPVQKAKELIKLYKTVGDYDNTKLWKKKVIVWLKKG